MTTAMLGGSFDPVHIGHLFVCQQVLTELGYDRMLLVPAYRAPLQPADYSATPEQRLAMLHVATQDNPRIAIDNWELEQKRTSYTIDTVRYLIRRCNPDATAVNGRLGLVVGSDQIAQFVRWRDYKLLSELVSIIVFGRPQHKPDSMPANITYIDNMPLSVSSSEIRRRIAHRLAFRYLVPDAVYTYIREQRLYGYEQVINPDAAETS